MKNFARKNQIIITALAVMIAVAGYLNFTGEEISENGLRSTSIATNNEKKAQDDKEAEENTDTKEDLETTMDISAEDEGEDYTVADNGELQSVSKENPGEAVMVSNTLGADYFAAAKLTREQNRAKNKETLMEIIDNKEITSEDKKSAIDQVAEMTEDAQMESAAELMLEAKGFTDAVVSIENGNADVIINGSELTQQQLAQITDIITRKTDISAENIVITPVSVDDQK